jgi:hypothetical protein
MRLIRTSFVVVVTIVLLALAVPAAQARPIDNPQPAVHSQGGAWLASALGNAASWLARLTGNQPLVSRTMKSTTTPPPPTTGGHYTPQGGNCIDPLGVGRCNV